MIEIKVQGNFVPYDRVCTHWTIWNKPVEDPLNYTVLISFDRVIDVFNEYWSNLIETENDPELDDGFEFEGVHAELKNANYPILITMLHEHSGLFCKYVMKCLQTEFIGYVVYGGNGVVRDKDFSLITVETMEIIGESVFITGKAKRHDRKMP